MRAFGSAEDSTVDQILSATADLRDQLLQHEIYGRIVDIPSLQVFMQHHAFAVLDFMWLLKRLQKELCCADLPWLPAKNSDLARFVNEIVLGEETDEDGLGGFRSHFELYLQSMDDVGADRSGINGFVAALRCGTPVSEALQMINAPASVREFVEFTYRIGTQGSPADVASAFCFGREDIIPDMFQRLLQSFESAELEVPRLSYYIRRHIELDGDHHGPLTRRMVDILCDSAAETQSAILTAQEAIRLRIRLWDGVLSELMSCGLSTSGDLADAKPSPQT